jgi:Protein of unknown function (DUF2865)
MRVFKNWLTSCPQRLRTGHAVALYALLVAGLCLALFGAAAHVVQQAEAPVGKLMQLGDADSGETKVAQVTTASSVLESDAWLQNLKAEYQTKDRVRGSRPLPTSSGLLGEDSSGLVDNKSPSLNESGSRRSSQQGGHRTVCVRMCDGYFWPISFATAEDNFERDQSVCENSCSSPAKLYVYENPGQEPEQMINLKGQPYSKLSTAFLFRTKLDQSCKCNPHPWEKEAMDRHRRYAEEAAKKKSMRQAEATGEATSEKKSKGGQGGKRTGNAVQNDQTTTANLTGNVTGVELMDNAFAPAADGGMGKYPRIVPGPVSIIAGTRSASVATDDVLDDRANNSEQTKRNGDDAIAVVPPKVVDKRAVKSTPKQSLNIIKGPASAKSKPGLDAPLMRLGGRAPASQAAASLQVTAAVAHSKQSRDWRVAIFSPR